MRKSSLTLFAICVGFYLMAQSNGETFTVTKGKSYAEPDSAGVYTFVEINPEYPGGDAGLIKFLQKNVRYPQMERDNNIQGKVLVRFVINEDGSVGDIRVSQPVSPGLDREAIRVVKMLQFQPAIMKGKRVKVYFNLPVVFKLP